MEELHAKIGKKYPVLANRCLALVSHIFTKAMEWEYVTSNPTSGIKKIREHARETVVHKGDIGKLLDAIDALRDPRLRVMFRLYLLTGCRPGELRKLRWSEVREDSLNLGETKSGRPHRVPLTAAAQALIASLERDGDFVFGGPRGPIVDVRKQWEKVRAASGMEDLQVRDLRRTVATTLSGEGVPTDWIMRLLNHTTARETQRVYIRGSDPSVRQALERMEEITTSESH